MYRLGLAFFVMTCAPVAYAETAPPEPPRWVATLDASATKADKQEIQPSVNLSLSRTFGKNFLGVSGTVTDTSNNGAPSGLVPTSIRTITLSGGRRVGRFIIEVDVSAGRGVFQDGLLAINQDEGIAASSRAVGYAAGASVSTSVALQSNLSFSPMISFSHSSTELNREPLDRGVSSSRLTDKSDGMTFSGGGSLLTRFGPSRRHGLTVTATVLHLQNTSDFITRTGRVDPVDIKDGTTDTLVDYGASVSLGLSSTMALDLSAIRSAWADGPQSTVVSAGLRTAF